MYLFSNFCNSELVEFNALWNTTIPDLSQCFQSTVFPIVLLIYTLIFSLPYIILLWRRRSYSKSQHWLLILKLTLSLLLLLTNIGEIVATLVAGTAGHQAAPSQYFASGVQAFLMIIYIIMAYYEHLTRAKNSGFYFIFWFLFTIVTIIRFRSSIITFNNEEPVDLYTFIPISIHLPLVAAQLVIACITISRDSMKSSEENICPEEYSSFLSRLSYWWFTGIVIHGFRKTIDQSMTWKLDEKHRSGVLYPKFYNILLKYLPNCVRTEYSNRSNSELPSNEIKMKDLSHANGSPLLEKEATDQKDEEHYSIKDKEPGDSDKLLVTVRQPCKVEKQSIWARHCILFTIIQAHWKSLLLGFVTKFMYDTLSFSKPQLLKWLLNFIADGSQHGWQGFFISGTLFCSILLQTIISEYHLHIMGILGMNIRSTINAAIYRKSMNLSNKARKASTLGEIVNLMAVDCQKFQDVTVYFNNLWSAPYVICGSIYFLYQEIGASVFAGVAVMIFIVPLNAIFAVIQRKLQAKSMVHKDSRIKLITEILNGIKGLKLYSWENVFGKKVQGIREKEVRILRNAAYIGAATGFTWYLSPFLVSFTSFSVYVSISAENVLTVQKTFSSLALFNLMRLPMTMFSIVISMVVQALVSLHRCTQFLLKDELDPANVTTDESESAAVVKNGTFTWDRDSSAIALKNINIDFPRNKLTAVVGPVGCGKSSLVSALLGEIEKLSGVVHVNGSTAYVSQTAWIRNTTARNNILFGKDFDANLYNCVVKACSLKSDFEALSDGDETEIGEKGINLSGGQKQRVSLARACYSEADIYIMDDPLSAVDAHVAQHIFKHVLGPEGILKNATRILVTHSVAFLPQCDIIVSLGENGRIQEQGPYQDLISHKGDFANFISTHLTRSNKTVHDDVPSSTPSPRRKRLSPSLNSNVDIMCVEEFEEEEPTDEKDAAKKLIQEETSIQGKVKLRVFLLYIKAIGILVSIGILVCYFFYNAFQLIGTFWLSRWSEDSSRPDIVIDNTTYSYAEYLQSRRISIYALFGFAQAIFQLLLSLLWAVALIQSARGLHNGILFTVLHCPMSFFETTPMGRILNRFSKDMDTVDSVLTACSSFCLMSLFTMLTVIAALIMSNPMILIPLVPILAVYVLIQRFYIACARQIKRLEAVSKSPIYSHFTDSLQGISIIRSYKHNERFTTLLDSLIDKNINMFYMVHVSTRWLALRIELIGNIIVFLTAVFAILSRNSGTVMAGLTGLSVTYALDITFGLTFLVRMSSELEANIVAVERIEEYSNLETEAAAIVESSRPPDSWPKGAVRFENYSCRYRKGLDLVLQDVTFEIKPGEKIGVVGRTGAGKSSLVAALFRIIEPACGKIWIDDINLSEIGLNDLRSRLTTIPQDPILFSGSLRLNLDPEQKADDQELWDALEDANLSNVMRESEDGLDMEITEGGENFSAGQRQLICLARALLRRTRILVLDEATSAVDLDSDVLIQKTIRRKFQESTVFTIAHRLNTIMDYDRILVMSNGKIEELDSPTNLLKNSSSTFYSLAKEANIVH